MAARRGALIHSRVMKVPSARRLVGDARAVADERPLQQGHGGSEISRSARGVHRTAGPWSPTVHGFLEHLHAAGFTGAPEPIGFDERGREVLTYIEGDVLGDPAWRPGEPTPWPDYARSEDALVAAAELVRRFHDAAVGFHPVNPVWKQHPPVPPVSGEVVCHGDIGPHNTVYRDGLPVAFIDWETIRPNDPMVEFGQAVWHYVPLGDDAYFERSGFGRTPDLAHRLEVFARAYGVADPDLVYAAVQQAKQRSVEAMRYWPISADEAGRYLRLVAAQLDWLHANRSVLMGGLS